MLSSDDILLLQELQSQPLKSYYAISESMGKAAQTIKKRYLELENRFQGSFAVIGDINYSKLHLQLVDAYIPLQSIAYAHLIENGLKQHEYIKYVARCIGLGRNSGIYAQFTIPENTLSMLREFLDAFAKKGYIGDYRLLVQTDHRFTKLPELDAWLPDQHRWNLTEEEIKLSFLELQNKPSKMPELDTSTFDLADLDTTKLIILEELSIDARRSERQIFKERETRDFPPNKPRSDLELDVSFTTFSRAMNIVDPLRTRRTGYENLRKTKQDYIEPELISGYRLHYSARLFSIFDTCLFRGRVTDETTLYKLYNLIKDYNPFKFRMNFSIYETGEFAWYIPIPSHFINAFTDGLSNFVTQDYDVIWINYGSAKALSFWPENFDLDKKQWKIGKEWCVDAPIARFERIEKEFLTKWKERWPDSIK